MRGAGRKPTCTPSQPARLATPTSTARIAIRDAQVSIVAIILKTGVGAMINHKKLGFGFATNQLIWRDIIEISIMASKLWVLRPNTTTGDRFAFYHS